MENFALIRVLGKGAYGKVFLVRKIGGHDSGRYYAMKVLKKTRVTQKQKTLEHTLAERKVLERLKGMPFLVNMIYAFQTETKLHIVMEFVRGGELFTHLCKRKKFDLPTARLILAEIVIALENVHRAGVIYRDLKLENILLDEDGHVKLTDFGLSKAFDEGPGPNGAATNSYCGTIEYMSPEIVRRTTDGYTQVVDWWSFGVIAFELLTGCSPFTVDGDQNSTADIAKRILTKRVPFPKTLDPTSRDFIAALLNKDPMLRLGAHEGATEIKRAKFFDGIKWDAVERRELAGPVKPKIVGGFTDVDNFAPEFTDQTPLFSPAEQPAPECNQFFRGYSFVSPSVIFANDNVIGQEYFDQSVRLLSAQNSAFFAKYQLDTTADGFLGRGSFSVCRRCTRLSDGRVLAVKIVSQRFAHQAVREIRILEMLNPHAHIVPLIEALSDQFHYYIVLELLEGGELLQRLRGMEKFTEMQAAEIMAQLVSAVGHMHRQDIVHRDLKPENILFESNEPGVYRLRLVDFGFARILPQRLQQQQQAKSLITPLCGTLHYAAPEVLDIEDELPQYNEQCDLWSLGVVLFTLLSGKVPFHAKSQAESAADIIARIRCADFSFEDPVWTMVSQLAKDLITGLLTVDPNRRLSLAQLARHPWLRCGEQTPPDMVCPLIGTTELPTPTILPKSADETFNVTHQAFISASREGFQLMDVQTAPLLVKRRGMKRQRGADAIAASGAAGIATTTDQQQQQRKTSGMASSGLDGTGGGGKLCVVPEVDTDGASTPPNNSNAIGNEANECGSSGGAKRRPTTLDVFGTVYDDNAMAMMMMEQNGTNEFQQQQWQQQQPPVVVTAAEMTTPGSALFTEYRDTRPPYLKYSRDDVARADDLDRICLMPSAAAETSMTTTANADKDSLTAEETDSGTGGGTHSESDGIGSAGSTMRLSNESN